MAPSGDRVVTSLVTFRRFPTSISARSWDKRLCVIDYPRDSLLRNADLQSVSQFLTATQPKGSYIPCAAKRGSDGRAAMGWSALSQVLSQRYRNTKVRFAPEADIRRML